MEAEGIQNAWTAKVLIKTARTRAITTRIGSSRQNDRLCRRWPGAGPAEDPGVSSSGGGPDAAAPGAPVSSSPAWPPPRPCSGPDGPGGPDPPTARPDPV